ncbi:MAG: hypothetical protein A07HR60_00795 [uncultured archaeon A07HR60]|nr:MAG: hypothetical protein A07HR60_00795 [uncultured archaeon A07HR60]
MFFSSKVALFTAEPVVFIREVESIDSEILRGMDVVGDPEINANTLLWLNLTEGWFRRNCVVRQIEPEGNEPLTSRLLFDCDLFDRRMGRYIAVIPKRDVSNPREPQCCSLTTRVFEFEARL